MDFNWEMFKMSVGLVVVFFGIMLGLSSQNKVKVDYYKLGLLAGAFLAYMYVICSGWISREMVQIFGTIGAIAIFYRFYLNNKSN